MKVDESCPVLRNSGVTNPASVRQPLSAPESHDPAVLVDVLVLSSDLLLFEVDAAPDIRKYLESGKRDRAVREYAEQLRKKAKIEILVPDLKNATSASTTAPSWTTLES